MILGPHKNNEKHLLGVAADQEGYFTAKQALDAGYSYRLQHYHKTIGHWIEAGRGIYRLAAYPHSTYEDLVRWSLWSFNRKGLPQAIISHDTALAVYELSDLMPSKIHLTVPPLFRKEAGKNIVYHRGIVPAGDVRRRTGFLITSPLRTIYDEAEGDLSLDHLKQAIHDGLQSGKIMRKDLQDPQLSPSAREKIKLVVDSLQEKT
jgi:hypothetical protein